MSRKAPALRFRLSVQRQGGKQPLFVEKGFDDTVSHLLS